MMIFLIILSCLLWLAAFAAFPRRIMLSPILSLCALILISLARDSKGYPVVPVSTAMILSWVCITLVLLMILFLQNPAVRMQSRGTGYMLLGAAAGMAVGLMAYTFTLSINTLYAIMIAATAVGALLGLLIFGNTPDGRAVNPGSGNFRSYLLAKGFPALVTVAMPGVAAVTATVIHVAPAVNI